MGSGREMGHWDRRSVPRFLVVAAMKPTVRESLVWRMVRTGGVKSVLSRVGPRRKRVRAREAELDPRNVRTRFVGFLVTVTML